MTVNLFPVSGVLNECHEIQHDSENMINWKQYIAVLITFSTVCPPSDQHGQATLVPRTYDAVTATELHTVIPVRQLKQTPGPTEALIIEASSCVFVHLDSRLHRFRVCKLVYVYCVLPSFLCRTKFSRCVKKEKQTKKCGRK